MASSAYEQDADGEYIEPLLPVFFSQSIQEYVCKNESIGILCTPYVCDHLLKIL